METENCQVITIQQMTQPAARQHPWFHTNLLKNKNSAEEARSGRAGRALGDHLAQAFIFQIRKRDPLRGRVTYPMSRARGKFGVQIQVS